MSDQWSRTVACRDGSGRPDKGLLFFLTKDGDLALKAPAGEVAVLAPPEIAEARDVIAEGYAEVIARRQRS